jgi:hypothetical protein
MKANITEVKKLVRTGGGGGGNGSGPKPPENVEGWEDPDDPKTPPKDPGDPGDPEDQEDPEPKKPGTPGGAGGGEGEVEWGEVEPTQPGAGYEVTPWTKPPNPTVIGEVHPTGSLGDGDKDTEAAKDKWKDITKSAENGNDIPSGIRDALKRMRAPIVDWRKELEVFIDDAISKSKYTLPSRRFLGAGKAQYGYKKYKEDFECVVVAIDTSGSISDKMVAQFLSEVKSIVDSYSPQDLYIMFCHTRVYRIDHIQPGDSIQVGKLESGGTEFYPPFKWTEKNLMSKGIMPSVFIYFTDGEATFPMPSEYGIGEYEDKCIWVLLTQNGQPFSDDIPFGNRIDITLPNKDVETI